uniref:Uncharacterized protein n=1 Tax=Lactuca sativa TaxID=4236 RepID=A0A9R1UJ67_LACSA|nr:hypothetical protein LSAT_V11C900464650 [Lactuca sativa]
MHGSYLTSLAYNTDKTPKINQNWSNSRRRCIRVHIAPSQTRRIFVIVDSRFKICTSKTKHPPNKKFKVFPNSLLATVKKEVSCLKKEVNELKKNALSYKVEITCYLL